ncbi:metallophosphoesterase [Klebsiella pneumoniae]|uniref:metallophosphoesterase n=1 Tax=Klebsiella pneumoniae TaxID=573 RepID=UPI003976027E
MSLYRSINGAIWRNIWVVGDLHGCHTLLMNELERVHFDPLCDLLISVGDLVDRGAENVECLELIAMPWFMAVRGNHEQMMLDGLSSSGNVYHWLANRPDGSLTLTTTKNGRLSSWSNWLAPCHLSSR